MAKRERALGLVWGPSGVPAGERRYTAHIEQAGHTVQGVMTHGGGAWLVYVRQDMNHPDRLRLWADHARQSDPVADGLRLNGRVDFKQRPAQVGWLRAAYLAAFAAYGYRYAFSPALAPVREQLAHPTQLVLPRFLMADPDAPVAARRVLRAEGLGPAPWRSLAVQMGRQVVFLPLGGEDSLYDRLAADRSPEGGSKATAVDLVPWPKRPMHRLDG